MALRWTRSGHAASAGRLCYWAGEQGEGGGNHSSSALRLFKLLLGAPDRQHTIDQYVRTGPDWPNISSRLVPLDHFKTCGRTASDGCLFELIADPYEQTNLAATLPARFAAMLARVEALQPTVYSPVRETTASPRACEVAASQGGYWGPFLSEYDLSK